MHVSVNGRFEGQRITGVQRYARELLARIGDRLAVVSPGAPIRGVRGHLWEQSVLPRRLRGGLLWSPCNTGPLAVRRQVVTIHDCGFHDHAQSFSPIFAHWYQWLIPRLARRARRIITVSEFSRQRLLEFTGVEPQRVVVIPNGVSNNFAPVDPGTVAAVKQRLGLPSRYVLSVGSLEPRKNLSRLLEAWRMLAPSHPDESLVLVGASSKQFLAVDFAGDLSSVVFPGYIDDADLPAVYAGATLFVYPSLYEGFGLPVLEAMACGAPVVCSNAASLPEVVGDAGILVDPLDPGAIAEGMRRVLADESLQARLKQGGLEMAGRFTWERAAAATWQVLSAATENN
jgi:glycosyltransferase involved in cell wall biosynthesis